jgi:hypothetical protein
MSRLEEKPFKVLSNLHSLLSGKEGLLRGYLSILQPDQLKTIAKKEKKKPQEIKAYATNQINELLSSVESSVLKELGQEIKVRDLQGLLSLIRDVNRAMTSAARPFASFTEVTPLSVAAAAGLLLGDLCILFGDVDIHTRDPVAAVTQVVRGQPQVTVSVSVLRNGTVVQLSLKLPAAGVPLGARIGALVRPYSPDRSIQPQVLLQPPQTPSQPPPLGLVQSQVNDRSSSTSKGR